jgi:hypothetical protein
VPGKDWVLFVPAGGHKQRKYSEVP